MNDSCAACFRVPSRTIDQTTQEAILEFLETVLPTFDLSKYPAIVISSHNLLRGKVSLRWQAVSPNWYLLE